MAGNPASRGSLQDAQAHQQIEAGHPGDAQGRESRMAPMRVRSMIRRRPESVRQTAQISREPASSGGAAGEGPAGGQGADREDLGQEREQG